MDFFICIIFKHEKVFGCSQRFVDFIFLICHILTLWQSDSNTEFFLLLQQEKSSEVKSCCQQLSDSIKQVLSLCYTWRFYYYFYSFPLLFLWFRVFTLYVMERVGLASILTLQTDLGSF